MAEETKRNVTRRENWIRLLFVVLFAIIYSVVEIVVIVVVLVQFGFVLIGGERNEKLLSLGESLSRYIYQILRFVTFNEDEKPFPFSDWPSSRGPIVDQSAGEDQSS